MQAELDEANGMHIHPYLDDWLICGPTQERAERDTMALLGHVTRLGLTINHAKYFVIPSQRVLVIGLTLDSRQMLVSPTPQRVEAVLQQVEVQPCSQAIGYVDISDISHAIGPLLLAVIPFRPMASI